MMPAGDRTKKGLIVTGVLFMVLFVIGITGIGGSNVLRYGFRILLYITIGEMWNLLSGYAGLTSLGQQAFIGLSGYALAVATTKYGLFYPLGIVAGLVISLGAAFVLSFLLLRIEGMYFSITTWVVAEALGTLFMSLMYVNRGAGMTVSAEPYPRIGTLYLMALVLCFASMITMILLPGSEFGLGVRAMRDDVQAAESLGVNVKRSRRIIYLVAAGFTALAGSLFFLNKGTIYPESGFDIGWTISMVFIVIIGGSGTVAGPVAGAVIYVFLSEILAHYPGWSNMILGAIAILMILFCPQGVIPAIGAAVRNSAKRRRKGSDGCRELDY
ncbi:MAG: branched-chain amino acid ABC transporter permease [Lachnospiraceae bacterium]|nr:branched-chain amino acid ABC transporter permease [Lachnospiraceae bacterium]